MEEVSSPDKEMARVPFSLFQMIDDRLLPTQLCVVCVPVSEGLTITDFFLHILLLKFLILFRFVFRLQSG